MQVDDFELEFIIDYFEVFIVVYGIYFDCWELIKIKVGIVLYIR